MNWDFRSKREFVLASRKIHFSFVVRIFIYIYEESLGEGRAEVLWSGVVELLRGSRNFIIWAILPLIKYFVSNVSLRNLQTRSHLKLPELPHNPAAFSWKISSLTDHLQLRWCLRVFPHKTSFDCIATTTKDRGSKRNYEKVRWNIRWKLKIRFRRFN